MINQAVGEYTLSLDVFANDWSYSYLWSGNAGSLALTANSPTPPPATVSPTNTPVPPTATNTATPPTATPLPATPTNTPLPPTATAIPPTATAGLPPVTKAPPGPPRTYILSIWWPTNGVTVSGTQPLKVRLENLALSQYNMYWQVDGGQPNLMANSSDGADHKEYVVDLSGWNWRGSGPYTLNFVAKDLSGNILQQSSVQIYVQH